MHRWLVGTGFFALAVIIGVQAQAGAISRPLKWETIDRITRSISPDRIEVSGEERHPRSFRVKVTSKPAGLPVNGTKISDCHKEGERRFRARPLTSVTLAKRRLSLTFADPNTCSVRVFAPVKRSAPPEHGTLRIVLQEGRPQR